MTRSLKVTTYISCWLLAESSGSAMGYFRDTNKKVSRYGSMLIKVYTSDTPIQLLCRLLAPQQQTIVTSRQCNA